MHLACGAISGSAESSTRKRFRLWTRPHTLGSLLPSCDPTCVYVCTFAGLLARRLAPLQWLTSLFANRDPLCDTTLFRAVVGGWPRVPQSMVLGYGYRYPRQLNVRGYRIMYVHLDKARSLSKSYSICLCPLDPSDGPDIRTTLTLVSPMSPKYWPLPSLEVLQLVLLSAPLLRSMHTSRPSWDSAGHGR
jgi:hypothetical protein